MIDINPIIHLLQDIKEFGAMTWHNLKNISWGQVIVIVGGIVYFKLAQYAYEAKRDEKK